MRRALFAIVLLAAAVAEAQVDTALSFEAGDQASSTAECSFQLTDGSGSLESSVGFLARPPRHLLNVSQLAGIGFTNAQVDTVLDAAAGLLQRDDTASDVGCCADLARTGNVATIGTVAGPVTVVWCGGVAAPLVGGVVTTGVELDFVRCATGNDDGDVIVVNGLTFCGQPGTYLGCASANEALVVTTAAGANTWAHEFGHVRGLGHAPTCGGGTCNDGVTAACNCATAGASTNNVMFCIACLTVQNVITSAECNAFRAGATP